MQRADGGGCEQGLRPALLQDFDFSFELEESVFESCAALCGEAADAAVAADYPMARNNQRQRILRHHTSYGPGGAGVSGLSGKLAITYRTTKFYLPASPQNPPGKDAQAI